MPTGTARSSVANCVVVKNKNDVIVRSNVTVRHHQSAFHRLLMNIHKFQMSVAPVVSVKLHVPEHFG
jgi:hypothetical protein